ncbi:hypothetical protein PM082_014225 [Marasmius tenuissimus]|nr:hypothetical protein PM082_014225 [Marasmius tenuissimus]
MKPDEKATLDARLQEEHQLAMIEWGGGGSEEEEEDDKNSEGDENEDQVKDREEEAARMKSYVKL